MTINQLLKIKKIVIKLNQVGFLYDKNNFSAQLTPGIYRRFDPWNNLSAVVLDSLRQLITVTNQEVLSKDNIAFRFSFYISFSINHPELFLKEMDFQNTVEFNIMKLRENIATHIQIKIRDQLAELTSEEINANRARLPKFTEEEINSWFTGRGITIQEIALRDLTFPKSVQDLFSMRLESKIRIEVEKEQIKTRAEVMLEEAKAKSQVKLEEAHSQVAAARALKNASEIMKDDEVAKFNKVLETLVKISSNGQHTFYLGDMLNEFVKNALTPKKN